MINNARRLRRDLERALGGRIWDEAWDDYVHRGEIARVLQGEKSVEDLLAEIRANLAAVEPASLVPGDMLPPLTRETLAHVIPDHPIAVSYLVAKHAAENLAIQAFRYEQLGAPPGRLLEWSEEEEVEQWIGRNSSPDGVPPALWLSEVPISGEQARDLTFASTLADWSHVSDVVVTVPAAQARRHLGIRFLRYRTPDDLSEHKIAITHPRGVLDRLRELSEQLAGQYAWTEAQATIHVLTGWVPLVETFTPSAHVFGRLPALARIQLTIDPALSPKEVADLYSELRSLYVGPRHRQLTDKHLALAMFVSIRPEEESWNASMQAWNSLQQPRHPDWVYTVPTNFSRDCLAARRRVLGVDESESSSGRG